MTLPAEAAEILRAGQLCYLGALTPRGPHVTPVVFALDGEEVWATTSRGAVKAKAWREDPRAGGLVGAGGRWVTFRGKAGMYDLLDPSTWRASVVRAPRLAVASARFTLKNARYFAGYARDARRVPLAWTPPARVVVSVRPEHGAVLEDARVVERWGRWPRARTEAASDSDDAPGPDLRPPRGMDLGDEGDGVVGLAGSSGPAVLPGRWRRAEGGGYLIALPRDVLALAGADDGSRAALVVDRASRWRASRMSGFMLQGTVRVLPEDAGHAVLRLRPDRLVWWKGWASGTVMPP